MRLSKEVIHIWTYNQTPDANELQHYGVLGMKWGVRRGRASGAFRKASKKANKLNEKYVKTNLKAAKVRKKALEKMSKATSERRYEKARKLEIKANRKELKAAKLQKKALKWEKSMEKTFSEVKVKDISPEDMEKGRKYAYMLAGQKR